MSRRPLVRDVRLLLGDTGPFCRFAETGSLEAMIGYLGDRLVVVRDVARELQVRAREPKHGDLGMLSKLNPPFPRGDPMDLDADSLRRVKIIAERWQRNQQRRTGRKQHEKTNYGEVATVLAAEREALPVLIDEGKGKAFATSRQLPVYTTEDVVAEMVAAGVIAAGRGFLIYTRVYGSTRAEFDSHVDKLRRQLAA